ncbi:hypothetical protein DIPPA_10116 [Diplonema papillatum]|nr:hypothetical protein DIPPA_10116 [Diplonema papillatum]
MTIDKVGAGSLPSLITAFAAAVPAEDIQAAIARRAPGVGPEINRRIDKTLAIAQRHKAIPMIVEEWLTIPGFAQKRRKRWSAAASGCRNFRDRLRALAQRSPP